MQHPKIAIIYLSYHCEPYIEDVVSSLKKLTYPKDKVTFVIVDNLHPQYGSSLRYLEDHVMPLSKNEIPEVVILPQKNNTGFAGGNNIGIKWAIDNNFDYVFFNNQDGYMAANCLEPLIETMENDKQIGVAQPLILLHPDINLINTNGNCFHYLGLAFCNNLRKERKTIINKRGDEIGFASGAALMMRVDLLKNYGLWDEDFFLYHEDLEYNLRVKSLGYKLVLVPDSIFYHKYSFSRNKDKFYFIERNRYGIMVMYFKWKTLLLLLPMAIILDLALLVFAWKNGWLDEKIRAYKYWLNSSNRNKWMQKRKKIQKIRKIKDRDLLKNCVTQIEFEEKSINNPVLTHIGNPLMKLYWSIFGKLIIW